MPVLAHALAYAARGIPVFPCRPGDKFPALKGWRADATTDLGRLAAMWERAGSIHMGNPNIGMPTGARSGIVVVDVDGGRGGLDTLDGLGLPATAIVASGSGNGFHHYFRGGVRTIPDLGPGIEIRGEGSLVVLPPSIHPSGGRYQWVSTGPLADFPESLIPTPIRNGAAVLPPVAVGRGADTPRGIRALEYAVGDLLYEDEGQRNHALYRKALGMRMLVREGHVTASTVIEQLSWAGREIGLGSDEIRKTILSGLNATVLVTP